MLKTLVGSLVNGKLNHLCLLVAIIEFGLLVSQDTRELPFIMITFQRDGPSFLKKPTFLELENCVGYWKKISMAKDKERNYNCKLSKVNTLRNGRRGTKSQ